MKCFTRIAVTTAASTLLVAPLAHGDRHDGRDASSEERARSSHNCRRMPSSKSAGATIGRIDIRVDDVFEDAACRRPIDSPTAGHLDAKTRRCVSSCCSRAASRLIAACSMKPRAAPRPTLFQRRPRQRSSLQRGQHGRRRSARPRRVDFESRHFLRPQGGENNTRLEFEDNRTSSAWAKQISASTPSDVDRTVVAPDLCRSASVRQLVDALRCLLLHERRHVQALALSPAVLPRSIPAGEPGRRPISRRQRHLALLARQAHRALRHAGAPVRNRRRNFLRPARWLDRALSRRLSLTTLVFASRLDEPDVARSGRSHRGLSMGQASKCSRISYLSTRNLDQIGRTEDLHLGRSAPARSGFRQHRVRLDA